MSNPRLWQIDEQHHQSILAGDSIEYRQEICSPGENEAQPVHSIRSAGAIGMDTGKSIASIHRGPAAD